MLKKAAVSVVVVLMMLFSINVSAVDTYGGYDIPVDIDINGNFIKCVQKPVMIDYATYIPLRAFSDAIGGVVEWDNTEYAAIMKKDGHTFVFYPDKKICIVDGVKKDCLSVMYKDLTFIPVRAVSDVLGYVISWDDFYQTVKIVAPGVVVKDEYKDKSYTYDDVLYLGKIIQIESGRSLFAVKLGVGGVVFNRVKSASFPNTVKDVIFDTKHGVQFPPVHTDMINTSPSKGSMIAAKCVLNGVNVAGKSLYFIETRNAGSSWVHNNRPYYKDIHGMSFYE
jgi:hypothetical protein